MAKQQVTTLNSLHIAPRKVRLLINTIKGLSLQEAEAQLLMRTQRSSQPLLKLLRSAAANATNNNKMNKDNLFVSRVSVDQGPVFKRSLPRAMGRATPLAKRTSHVTLVLEEAATPFKSRFEIAPPVKKTKKTKKPAKAKEAAAQAKKPTVAAEQPKEKPKGGFFKKMFRRKSV